MSVPIPPGADLELHLEVARAIDAMEADGLIDIYLDDAGELRIRLTDAGEALRLQTLSTDQGGSR